MLNSKFTTLLLIGICTILGNLIYYMVKNPQETPFSISTAQTAEIKLEKMPVSQVKSLADISQYDEIIQRPLFNSERQPEKEIIEEKEIQQIPTRNPDLKLAGIVLSNEEKVALIKSRKKQKLQRIMLEETIDGWKLIEIKANSAILESGSKQITLELTRKADPTQAQKKPGGQRPNNKQQTLPAGSNLGTNSNIKRSQKALRNFEGIKTIPANPENQSGISPEDEEDD